MSVLVAGMRALNTNFDQSQHGVFTKCPGSLTNDFFVNLLDMSTRWTAVSDTQDILKAVTVPPVNSKWTATRVDLIFGSNLNFGQ